MKIVILGAGAYELAPALLDDLFVQYQTVCDLWIVDDSLDTAELTARAAQSLARAAALPARVFYTANPRKALPDADYVLWCHEAPDAADFARDLAALDAIGLGKQARPFGGIGGAMTTLREGGALADVCEEMTRVCPQAALIVCSGPVARLCELAQRSFGVRALGLCRAPYDAAKRCQDLLGLQDAPETPCAGTWGFAWALGCTSGGRDCLDQVKERLLQDAAQQRVRDRERAAEEAKAADAAKPDADVRGSLSGLLQPQVKETRADLLSAQYVDWYDALPASGLEWQMMQDTPESPRLTQLPGVPGEADCELRLRHLASLAVHGPLKAEGRAALEAMRASAGPLRPMRLVHALSGRVPALYEPGLIRPNDGAISCVPDGRFVLLPSVVSGPQLSAQPLPPFPMALEELLDRVTEANLLYAQAAAFGDRIALREALEADPALAGVDLLYALDTVDDMVAASALPRF